MEGNSMGHLPGEKCKRRHDCNAEGIGATDCSSLFNRG